MVVVPGAASMKSAQTCTPTFSCQVHSRLKVFQGHQRFRKLKSHWESSDESGLAERATALCQQACPQPHYLAMRALFCKVRRKDPANPCHGSAISVLSLIFLQDEHGLCRKAISISLDIREQAGYCPECGQIKGKGRLGRSSLCSQVHLLHVPGLPGRARAMSCSSELHLLSDS